MNAFACPSCNAQQEVPAAAAGTQVACNQCGAAMAIPANTPVAAAKPIKPQAAKRRRRRLIPLIALAVIFVIIGVAFFTNPTREKFELQTKDDRTTMEKLVGNFVEGEILLTKTFHRKNCFIYSIGTITIRHRITGKEAQLDVIGAFGRWWLEYPVNVSGDLIKI